MNQYCYSHALHCWLLRCTRCQRDHLIVFETPDGDLCRRCLDQPDPHPRRAYFKQYYQARKTRREQEAA